MSDLHSRITSDSGSINYAIIIKDEVDKAINHLKNNKHNDDCVSDHFIRSPTEIREKLSVVVCYMVTPHAVCFSQC